MSKKLNDKKEDIFLYSIGEAHVLKLANDKIEDMTFNMSEMDNWFENFSLSYKKIEKHDKRKKGMRQFAKIAAVILFTLSIAFTGIFVGVEAFRLRVLNLIVSDTETHTLVENTSYNELTDLGVIIPNVIPDGMKLYSYESIGNLHKTVFKNDAGNFITLTQSDSETQVQFDTEDVSVKEYDYEGYSLIYIEKKGIISIYWEYKTFNFSIVSDLSKEILHNFIKNMK